MTASVKSISRSSKSPVPPVRQTWPHDNNIGGYLEQWVCLVAISWTMVPILQAAASQAPDQPCSRCGYIIDKMDKLLLSPSNCGYYCQIIWVHILWLVAVLIIRSHLSIKPCFFELAPVVLCLVQTLAIFMHVEWDNITFPASASDHRDMFTRGSHLSNSPLPSAASLWQEAILSILVLSWWQQTYCLFHPYFARIFSDCRWFPGDVKPGSV